MAVKRKDSKNRVLKENESERRQGGYQYRWRDSNGNRHTIYAKTLDELRDKESLIKRDKLDGIKTESQNATINDMYDIWVSLKKGLKNNTFVNYKYMYEQFVRNGFGETKLSKLRKTDVMRFYNFLLDERGLKISTVDNINTVLHQVLDLAVDDLYLRNNPSNNVIRDLKRSRNFFQDKKRALTIDEQNLFLDFIKDSEVYSHWYPVFTTMLGTGLRVGEITGLRWEDINFEEMTIDVNHTLVFYSKYGHGEGLYYGINTPKTKAGERKVPMIPSVKEALLLEKENQEKAKIYSNSVIDNYSNFIFLNRYGNVQNQGTLNKALRRIIRDCNQEVLSNLGDKDEVVLLPRISCHTLRHTFTTRMCEANVNIKVIQNILGHSDIGTTLDIYADVTKDFKKQEFDLVGDFIGERKNKTLN